MSSVLVDTHWFLTAILWLEITFTILWIFYGYILNYFNFWDALLLFVVPILQAIWASAVICIGSSHQFFVQDYILNSFSMIWLPMFPIIVQTSTFFWKWDKVSVLLSKSLQYVLGLQGIRILAVGSLIKWRKGIFPTAFAWLTAFPDMLFGLSAWLMVAKYRQLECNWARHSNTVWANNCSAWNEAYSTLHFQGVIQTCF